MREVAITTSDNPFDPLDDFDRWYQFDVEKGYNTCAYLARIAHPSDALSDSLNDLEIENAIDEILRFNLTGNYKKIVREQ